MVSELAYPRQESVGIDWVGNPVSVKSPNLFRPVATDCGGALQLHTAQQRRWHELRAQALHRPAALPRLFRSPTRPYFLSGYGGGPERSVGKECLGVIGLGSSACKIPSRFQSGSVELAPAREPHLLRQVPDPSDLRRRLGSAELALAVSVPVGGRLDRRLVKVPGSTPSKIPKPSSDLGKMTKSVVRYEEDAYDHTAVWRIVHLRPSEQARERELEMARSAEDSWQISQNGTQGTQLMSTPEGNFNFPSTDLSVVVTGWEQDQVPNVSVRRMEWENPDEVCVKNDARLEDGTVVSKSEGVEFTVKDGLECAVLEDFGIPSWLFELSLPNTDLNQRLGTPGYKAFTGDGHNVDRKLRQKLDMTEDEAHSHMKQGAILYNLKAQTLPKIHHCYFIRLTLEYFKFSSLDSYEFSACKIKNPKHWHYVILPKNIISAFVVMNSTVSSSKKPGNIVSHILTDAQNFHAMKLWFVKNAHKKAYVHVINHEAILLEKLPKFSNQKLYWPEEFRVLIYNISYIRGLFPKKNFTDKSVSALEMKIKKLKPMDDESRRLIDWMEKSAYDALQKKYLKTLLCCICEKEEDPLILIHDKKVSNLHAVVKVLELALKNHKPLLLVTVDVESEALDTLIIQMLGSCKKVTVSKDDTVILARAGDKKFIEERADQIRSAIEQSISDYDKEKLQEGLAKLSGGVAVLKIGGASGVEMTGGVGSKHMAYLPDMIPCLLDLLNDETPAVARQAVKAGTSLFATVLEQLVIQGLFSSGGIEDSLNISWVITACLGLIKSATSHYDGGTVAIDSKKEFYGLQDLGEDEPNGLTDVVEKSFDRQDRGLRGTRLLWNLPPWPGLCAMICDHFTQHSDYEVLENFYSVKRYNQRVLDYTDKFKELMAVYKSESMKLRHEVGEERKMLQMVEAMAEVLPNARHP